MKTIASERPFGQLPLIRAIIRESEHNAHELAQAIRKSGKDLGGFYANATVKIFPRRIKAGGAHLDVWVVVARRRDPAGGAA